MKKYFFTFCFLLCLFLLKCNTALAKDYIICSKPFLSKIELAHSTFINSAKIGTTASDALFYEYLKTFQNQVELMNKWNVEDIQNFDNGRNKDAMTTLCLKNNLKIEYSEVGAYFVPNYENVLIQNKSCLTPQMITWLEYLKNNVQIVDDAALNIPIDNVRTNIISLENLIKNNTGFVAKDDVIRELNDNALIYTTNFDNTPMYDAETKTLKSDYKESYKKFITENKTSAYYDDILNFYTLLESNGFKEIKDFKITCKYPKCELIESHEKNSATPVVAKQSIKNVHSLLLDIVHDFFGISAPSNNQVTSIASSPIQKIPTTRENFEAIKIEQSKETLAYLQCVFDDVYNLNRRSEEDIKAYPNIKNAIDAMDNDYKIISGKFEEYDKNKNNMAQNYKIYSEIKIFSKQYNEMIESYENVYKNAYEIYKNNLKEKYEQIIDSSSNDYSTKQEAIAMNILLQGYSYKNFKEEFYDSEQTKGYEIIENLKTTKNNFDTKASEIFKYSFNYEENKTKTYMKQNGKKLEGGDIAAFIYLASYYNPTTSYIYNYNSYSHPIYILQAVNNGVMVRGDYSLGFNSSIGHIFIQTSKKYVANQALKRNTYYVYTGTMRYKTAFGITNTVWKFRELSQTEIKNNFMLNYKLYFYKNH